MQWTYEMFKLKERFPEITFAEMEAIEYYWREYFENAECFKGTELEKMVFEWLKSEKGKEVVRGYRQWDT